MTNITSDGEENYEIVTSESTEDVILKQYGTLFLWGNIATGSTANIIKYILMQNFAPTHIKEIRLVINSAGGDLFETFALIDVMQSSKIPIHTIGMGHICSAALLIFINGTRGLRSLYPNTSIMSHQYSASSYGKEHELTAVAKEYEHIKKRTVELYKKATKLPVSKIEKFLLPASDVWLTAEEAIEYKLADRIIKTL